MSACATGHGPTAVAGPAACIADCGYSVCVCDPRAEHRGTPRPSPLSRLVTRRFMVADNRCVRRQWICLGKPNLITLAPNSVVVGDAVANHLAQFVRAHNAMRELPV